MHFVALFTLGAVAVSTSASLVARQSHFPQCAQDCENQEIPYSGCLPNDNFCLCSSKTFVSTVTSCFEHNCTGNDLLNSINLADELCATVGVTLTSSVAPSTSPTSSAASTGSSASSTSTSKSAAAAAPHNPNTFLGLVAVLGLATLAL